MRFEFCLSHESFELQIQGEKLRVAQGLSFIAQQGLRQGVLNTLAIEHAIYVIEELLEQLHLDYHVQRIALSDDVQLEKILNLFFNAQHRIDRVMLEHAFNEFVERTEYYVSKIEEQDLSIFLYFIFLREMMHHLNVTEIQFISTS